MEDILANIRPTPKEIQQLHQQVDSFLQQLSLQAIIGGSYAKGTWLAGNYDIDIFIPYQKQEKDISNKLEKHLTKKFKNVTRVHGSRDYFQITNEGITFELIPVKTIQNADDAENITDVSPLHVTWVNSHTNPFLKDQVRLAKQFCKAHAIYGAETYIKGFSGYVLEILIVHYGNFAKLLKHSLHWNEGMIIDVAGHYNGINDDKKSALNVIDPVQASRNAAAALSIESMHTFQVAARAFLQHPTIKAFDEKHLNLQDLKHYDLVIKAIPLKGKKDTVGTQLLKAYEYLTQKLTDEGYTLTEKGWQWNTNAYFWYTIKNKKLSATKKHYGPPIIKQPNIDAFRKKYKKLMIHIEEKRVYVNIPRKHKILKDYAKALLKAKEITKRVKKIQLLSP